MISRLLKPAIAGLFAMTFAISTAFADVHNVTADKDGLKITSTADKHAPIGVMRDHTHGKGEWMLSYRFMHMDMDGSRRGSNDIDNVTIATTIPNRFFGTAGQPPTLRVVPTSMTMDMHMFGIMYAPADWLTLMVMGQWLKKDMDHTTFAGGAGTAVLGTFKTDSQGWGDTNLSSLIKLYSDSTHKLHLNLGVSLPTGSIDENAIVLAPTGATPTLRMPYAMQLGTGTYDLLPGLTYYGHHDNWGWGAQYNAEIRLEDKNSESYAWGNQHSLSLWASYQWQPWISTSFRLTGRTQDDIDGIDPQIVAPVQTADPDNYGGKRLDAAFGINLVAVPEPFTNHRLAFEVGTPLYQDLNGVQLEQDWTFTIGWQKAF